MAAGKHELSRGTEQRFIVDAAMLLEAPVLVADQHLEKARVDLVPGHRQPPAPVGDGEGTEQPVVAIDHNRRSGDLRIGNHRTVRLDPPRHEAQPAKPGDHRQREARCRR